MKLCIHSPMRPEAATLACSLIAFSLLLQPAWLAYGQSPAGRGALQGGGAADGGPPAGDAVGPGFVMDIEVSLLSLSATVVDPKGRVVRGLEKEDFSLWVDGHRQEISHFSTDSHAALSLAVMLDVSGSMGLMQKLENSRLAVRRLVGTLEGRDQAALFTFAETSVAPVVEFTEEPQRVIRAVEALRPYGKTALYRALEETPGLLGAPRNRLAIVLLTDGIDNCARLPLERTLSVLADRRIPIYTVCFTRQFFPGGGSSEEYVRIPVLESIAGRSGGDYLEVSTEEELVQGLDRILSELRYQYLIGFPAGAEGKPLEARRIRLRTSRGRNVVRVGRGWYSGGRPGGDQTASGFQRGGSEP